MTFDFAQVSFDVVQDDAECGYLNEIGTSFDLSDEEIGHLIAAARRVRRESPEFQAFLKRTQGNYLTANPRRLTRILADEDSDISPQRRRAPEAKSIAHGAKR